jgi:hypothetical protein
VQKVGNIVLLCLNEELRFFGVIPGLNEVANVSFVEQTQTFWATA